MNGLQNGKTELTSRGHNKEIKDSKSERTRGKKKQDVLTEINVGHCFAREACKGHCICGVYIVYIAYLIDFILILCTVHIDGTVGYLGIFKWDQLPL